MNDKSTVLIVDDEQRIRSLLSNILTMKGFKTLQAEKGELALKVINEQPVDAVLLDLMLPEMNGIEVLETIRERYPHLPVIIITAYGSVNVAVEALKKGAYDFLEKPLDADKVAVTLKNAVEKYRMTRQIHHLQESLLEKFRIVGKSPAIENLRQQIKKLAPLDCTVLITGETGTGKELVARNLHSLSPRVGGPFVKVNCAAIPHELIESELFGYAKGAFTSAYQDKQGKFEAAAGGTLFLDEIGELSMSAQAKLLQILDEKKYTRLGEVEERKVNVRIIAATNQDLYENVDQGKFRVDLLFRLNTVHLHIPPLRERPEDIPELVQYYLPLICEENELGSCTITSEAVNYFLSYHWPGNVRELQHKLQEMLIFNQHNQLDANYVQQWFKKLTKDQTLPYPPIEPKTPSDLRSARKDFERRYIIQALNTHNWNIPATAKYLGIERTNLYRKMRELGIGR